MKLSVITPIGPGHQGPALEAAESVSIAWRTARGPFTDIERIMVDDSEGLGRSGARNFGIDQATGDWLFFLDADDLMHPMALKEFGTLWRKYDAVWGLIVEMGPQGPVERVPQVRDIKTFERLRRHDPFQTIQIGHFVRRDKVLRFREDMDVGEDFAYYLDMWRSRRCVKVPRTFYVNRRGMSAANSSSGYRWREVVEGLLRAA
jgi:glycosyltransferase involved in cell wall biosynthesis